MSNQGPSEKEVLLDAIAQNLGQEAIQGIQPQDVSQPTDQDTSKSHRKAPVCMTQSALPRGWNQSGITDIVVGFNKEVPRWKPGSIVKWAAWRAGFQNQDDADYAAMQLAQAAEVWNKADIGVTFEWVPLAKDATFVLYHAGDGAGVLARAFFPNNDDLSSLVVFSDAFAADWKPVMWKIFTHELGHVLGLRHEFAITGLPERGIGPEGFGAVQLGPRNPKSVMNYSPDPPEMQQSDIDSTKMFYGLQPDVDGKPPKVGTTEVKDYIPQ
ncbi:hypothetical protein NW768_011228 [Fusarium equiseti]|uniref:Peptidase metallopeptidase domain-containing protein n=1 Tax=Fusarium equiseti TaxID=61235 RepID=A0ABQ8QYS0_FUSEQ|nr:hypothetical protein NW768_011228 [Fusarium equiseti]